MQIIIILIGLITATDSLIGLLFYKASSFLSLILPNGYISIFALIMGIILILVSRGTYNKSLRTFWFVFGLVLSTLAILGVFEPTYYGIISKFVHPANLMVLLLAGVGFMMTSFAAE